MRRRNKKVNRHSRFTVNTAGVVALLMTGFAMVMCYCVLGMRCTSIAQELQQAEKEYKQLTKENERVAARWTELMAVDRLQEKLVRFGLEMNIPRADQMVRLNASGRPLPGQIAVARARERLATANMAQMAPEAQSRKKSSRGKVR
ncbi:MAG: hypothetical protein J6V72_10700 [Kiritimatiellae bacterium]|nr:hypothetical protein [Kiritimatiellia bacterium]